MEINRCRCSCLILKGGSCVVGKKQSAGHETSESDSLLFHLFLSFGQLGYYKEDEWTPLWLPPRVSNAISNLKQRNIVVISSHFCLINCLLKQWKKKGIVGMKRPRAVTIYFVLFDCVDGRYNQINRFGMKLPPPSYVWRQTKWDICKQIHSAILLRTNHTKDT